MKTILITGASGFFGKSLIQALRKTSTNNRFICLYHSEKPEIDDQRFTFVQGNILNIQETNTLVQELKPTHCIHLAWHVPPQTFWHTPENVDWLHASVHLFESFCKAGGKVFIGAGSLSEYDWSKGVLDEEKTPLNPQTLYALCKKSSHDIMRKIRDRDYPEAKIIWPRIGYFFGPNESQKKLMSTLMRNIKASSPLKLISKETRRPYSSVKYAGEILANLLETQNHDLVFNLNSSKLYSLQEIVDFISEKYQKPQTNVEYDAYKAPLSEPLTLNVSTKKLKELGLEIPDTFFEDLKDMIQRVS